MKRTLFQMSLILVLAALIASCAPAPAPATPPPAVANTVIVEVEKVVTATPAPVEEEGPFKVALILPSTTKDASFSQAMYDALITLQQEMGEDKLEIAYSESMFNLPNAVEAIRDYAAQGYNLVIAHGSQYGSSLADIAPDFPTTAFAWGTTINTFQSEGVNNIFAYSATAEVGGYIMGYMGAMMSTSKRVGICGPVETGDNRNYVIGVEQGVKDANLGVTASTIWTGSYSDVTAMATCAQTHIQDNADVLYGSSQSSTGAIAAAMENNVYWFGHQNDNIPLAPEVVVASQVYDFVPTVTDMIATIKAGVYGGKVYILTFQNDGLVMKLNDGIDIPADVRAKPAELIEKIKAGEITIPID